MRSLLIITTISLLSLPLSTQNVVVEGKIGIDTNNPSQAIDMGGRLRNIRFDYTHLGETGNGAATILANKARASETVNNRVDYSDSNSDGVSAIEMFYENGISFFTKPIDIINPTVEGDEFFTLANRTYERMRITGDGRVGIGTTDPSSPLDVYTDLPGARAIRGVSTGNEFVGVGVYGQGFDGVRGVATASQGWGVYGTSSGVGVYGHSGTSGTGVLGQSTSGTGIVGQSFASTGVEGRGPLCDFDAVGNGTNYCSSSSRRWKNNIVNLSNPLQTLSKIRGVRFTWDEEHGGHDDIGFIAEEVGKVLPSIVVYESNGVDASSMDYSMMTPVLVEAANAMRKEYQEKFDDQQSEIDALRQEMAELRMLLKEHVTQGVGDE